MEQYLTPTIAEELDPILSFTEPLVPSWFTKVPDHEVAVLSALRDKYEPFGFLVMTFAPYSAFLRTRGFPKLPLRETLKGDPLAIVGIPSVILDAIGYREFLNECLEFGLEGIGEFREVRKRNNL